MVALANHPFMNNLTQKIRGESVGRLPEGQSSRAIYLGADPPSEEYDALQQQSTDDQSEVNQVQSLLSENTPPPVVDESQFNDGCDSEQQPGNVDTDVASDGLPPATSSAHTRSSVESILGTSDEPLVAAEVAVQTRPQRLRGRPLGVKNKPKTKVEAAPRARRQVQKRARESQLVSSDSDTFDITTPIVVRVQPNVRANEPPPPKKTRRTKATTANITTVEEGHEHIERQRQRGVIIRNLSTDLESFLNHLNDQDAVSGLYILLNIKSQAI